MSSPTPPASGDAAAEVSLSEALPTAQFPFQVRAIRHRNNSRTVEEPSVVAAQQKELTLDRIFQPMHTGMLCVSPEHTDTHTVAALSLIPPRNIKPTQLNPVSRTQSGVVFKVNELDNLRRNFFTLHEMDLPRNAKGFFRIDLLIHLKDKDGKITKIPRYFFYSKQQFSKQLVRRSKKSAAAAPDSPSGSSQSASPVVPASGSAAPSPSNSSASASAAGPAPITSPTTAAIPAASASSSSAPPMLATAATPASTHTAHPTPIRNSQSALVTAPTPVTVVSSMMPKPVPAAAGPNGADRFDLSMSTVDRLEAFSAAAEWTLWAGQKITAYSASLLKVDEDLHTIRYESNAIVDLSSNVNPFTLICFSPQQVVSMVRGSLYVIHEPTNSVRMLTVGIDGRAQVHVKSLRECVSDNSLTIVQHHMPSQPMYLARFVLALRLQPISSRNRFLLLPESFYAKLPPPAVSLAVGMKRPLPSTVTLPSDGKEGETVITFNRNAPTKARPPGYAPSTTAFSPSSSFSISATPSSLPVATPSPAAASTPSSSVVIKMEGIDNPAPSESPNHGGFTVRKPATRSSVSTPQRPTAAASPATPSASPSTANANGSEAGDEALPDDGDDVDMGVEPDYDPEPEADGAAGADAGTENDEAEPREDGEVKQEPSSKRLKTDSAKLEASSPAPSPSTPQSISVRTTVVGSGTPTSSTLSYPSSSSFYGSSAPGYSMGTHSAMSSASAFTANPLTGAPALTMSSASAMLSGAGPNAITIRFTGSTPIPPKPPGSAPSTPHAHSTLPPMNPQGTPQPTLSGKGPAKFKEGPPGLMFIPLGNDPAGSTLMPKKRAPALDNLPSTRPPPLMYDLEDGDFVGQFERSWFAFKFYRTDRPANRRWRLTLKGGAKFRGQLAIAKHTPSYQPCLPFAFDHVPVGNKFTIVKRFDSVLCGRHPQDLDMVFQHGTGIITHFGSDRGTTVLFQLLVATTDGYRRLPNSLFAICFTSSGAVPKKIRWVSEFGGNSVRLYSVQTESGAVRRMAQLPKSSGPNNWEPVLDASMLPRMTATGSSAANALSSASSSLPTAAGTSSSSTTSASASAAASSAPGADEADGGGLADAASELLSLAFSDVRAEPPPVGADANAIDQYVDNVRLKGIKHIFAAFGAIESKADDLRKDGNYPECRKMITVALRLCQLLDSKDPHRYIGLKQRLVTVAKLEGKLVEARDHIQDAVNAARLAAEEDPSPQAQEELAMQRLNLAGILSDLGLAVEAITQVRQAIKILEEFKGNLQRSSQCRIVLVSLLTQQATEACLSEAYSTLAQLEMFQQQGILNTFGNAQTHAVFLQTYGQLCRTMALRAYIRCVYDSVLTFFHLRDALEWMQRADAKLRECVELCNSRDVPVSTRAESLLALADLCFAQGHLTEAYSMQKVVEDLEEQGAFSGLPIVRCKAMLLRAMLYQTRGDVPEALRTIEDALRRLGSNLGDKHVHPLAAQLMEFQASLAKHNGRTEDAKRLLISALRIRQSLLLSQESNPYTYQCQVQLSLLSPDQSVAAPVTATSAPAYSSSVAHYSSSSGGSLFGSTVSSLAAYSGMTSPPTAFSSTSVVGISNPSAPVAASSSLLATSGGPSLSSPPSAPSSSSLSASTAPAFSAPPAFAPSPSAFAGSSPTSTGPSWGVPSTPSALAMNGFAPYGPMPPPLASGPFFPPAGALQSGLYPGYGTAYPALYSTPPSLLSSQSGSSLFASSAPTAISTLLDRSSLFGGSSNLPSLSSAGASSSSPPASLTATSSGLDVLRAAATAPEPTHPISYRTLASPPSGSPSSTGPIISSSMSFPTVVSRAGTASALSTYPRKIKEKDKEKEKEDR